MPAPREHAAAYKAPQTRQHASNHSPDPDVVAALSGGSATADRALSLRTRRAIYSATMAQRSARHSDRRNLSIAFLVTGALTLALAPALWAGMDDLLGGETLLDLPGMLVALCVMMFAAVAAVLSLLGRDRDLDASHFRK